MAGRHGRDVGRGFQSARTVRAGTAEVHEELFVELVATTGTDELSSPLELNCGTGQVTTSTGSGGASGRARCVRSLKPVSRVLSSYTKAECAALRGYAGFGSVDSSTQRRRQRGTSRASELTLPGTTLLALACV